MLEGVSIVRSRKNLSDGFNRSPAKGRIISYSFAPRNFFKTGRDDGRTKGSAAKTLITSLLYILR